MRTSRRPLTIVAVALATLLALSACASTEEDVRSHIADNYELINEDGSYAAYRSNDSVGTVAAAISSAAEPGRDLDDPSGRYLGYKSVMVHIQQANTGGSEIEVTDARDGYDRWGPTIIPIWGSFGGSYRSGFSGGGSGFGGK